MENHIKLTRAIEQLAAFIEKEQFRGYDPYDTLNSFLPFQWLGKWGPVLAIQFQKRNPVNIRPVLGIGKSLNPKAVGLLLHAYSISYQETNSSMDLNTANTLYRMLDSLQSAGYQGSSWGYNFPWASSEKYLKAFTPSAVVTGFVTRGLHEYLKIQDNPRISEMIHQSAVFVKEHLPHHFDEEGLCISYTPVKKDHCYNASLLAAEIYARSFSLGGPEQYKQRAIDAVNWVIARQHDDGHWNYSINLENGKERSQIDFHQGYILESIFNIKELCNSSDPSWDNAIRSGLHYYKTRQFYPDGRAIWRVPKEYPVDIHNQAQGIITFAQMEAFLPDSLGFSDRIASWTFEHMRSKKGYFYYRKFPGHVHRIPYMRWSQAWMLLALNTLKQNMKK